MLQRRFQSLWMESIRVHQAWSKIIITFFFIQSPFAALTARKSFGSSSGCETFIIWIQPMIHVFGVDIQTTYSWGFSSCRANVIGSLLYEIQQTFTSMKYAQETIWPSSSLIVLLITLYNWVLSYWYHPLEKLKADAWDTRISATQVFGSFRD